MSYFECMENPEFDFNTQWVDVPTVYTPQCCVSHHEEATISSSEYTSWVSNKILMYISDGVSPFQYD